MVKETVIEEAVKNLFETIKFEGEPQSLYDPLKYMIAIGGKRIRPRLLLLCYGLYHNELSQNVIEAAGGIEVFHTFTLMHDDIMDNAPIRRGKATVWKEWSTNAAILSGDVMLIDAYKRFTTSAPANKIEQTLALFSHTAEKVCQGQQLDMEFESREKISMDEYIRMIGLKTAELLAGSAALGAIYAGAPEEESNILYRFAYNLGLAFQIMDDYLDTYGDPAVFGKTIGGDILCDKKTWLLTKVLESTDSGFLNKEYNTPLDKIAAVRAIYDSQDIAGQALAEVELYHNKALKELERLPCDTSTLKAYAESLLYRKN